MSTPSNPSAERILQDVRGFVVATFRHGRSQGIDEHTPLRTAGILDLAGMPQLVEWLESHFHIRIEPSEQRGANFTSLAAIVRLVQRKLG
jgi:acyl carrier protein